MSNLKKMNVSLLDQSEMQATEGGFLVVAIGLKLTADAINWAYTEYKKGVADGYNKR